MWTVFVVLLALAARFTATDNKWEKVYLHQLTIYTTHEAGFGRFRGTPEVYLSCDDGLPSVDIEQVKSTYTVYTFAPGAQPTTQLGSDGCVTCRLKERDLFSSDDVFGEWKMCIDDFAETGSLEVIVTGEFKALFECPVCTYVEPPLVPPTVQPVEPPVEPPVVPPSIPPSDPPVWPGAWPPTEPPAEPPEVEAPSARGSKEAVGSEPSPGFRPGVFSPSESASDSDYDEIIDEMIRIDMEDFFDFDTEAKAQ